MPADATMTPWTLTFADAVLERSYTEKAFRTTCRPLAAFCAVTILMEGMLAISSDPGMIAVHAITATSFSVFLAARLWLDHMHDQQHARILFGRLVPLVGMTSWLGASAWLNLHPPAPSPGIVWMVMTLLWFLVAVYLRCSAVDITYRFPFLLVANVMMISVPPLSSLGHPAEQLCLFLAILLGEATGYHLERHMRLAYVPRAAPIPAEAVRACRDVGHVPDSIPPAMLPWTLTFTDAALERSYTERAFRYTCRPLCAFCAVVVLLHGMLATVSDPSMIAILGSSAAISSLVLAARLWLDRMHNQQRARTLFGRAFFVAHVCSCVGDALWLHFHPLGTSPAAILVAPALVSFMVPIYMHVSATDIYHRLATLCLLARFVVLDIPPMTTFGRPTEQTFLLCILVIGEVVGFTLESSQREARLLFLKREAHSHPECEAQVKLHAQPQADPVSPPAMLPWTLTFTDDALERRYTMEAFHGVGYRPYVLGCVASIMLSATIAILYQDVGHVFVGAMISSTTASFLLAARLWLDRMHDQHRARILFGRNIIAAALVRWGSTVAWARSHIPEPDRSHIAVVAISALVWFILAMYLRCAGIASAHRLVILVIGTFGAIALPPLSTLGRPSEPLCILGALALGELIGFTVDSFWRASRLQQHENELLQQQAKAQAETYRRDNDQLRHHANAKDHFVASLSHEMRTPLNGVVGAIELAKSDLEKCLEKLKRGSLVPDDLVDIGVRLGVAGDGSEMLNKLVEDTLDVTRIEQGRLQLDIHPMSLTALVHNCAELAEPNATKKQIDLRVHIDPAVEGECMGDLRRLKQVILNLLSNAVKFTHVGGSVSIRLTRREPQQAAGEESPAPAAEVLPVMLTVVDNGIGLHPLDREIIFIKYTKATENSGGCGIDRHAGAGLGLSICKAIVELHDGTIALESTLGYGSSFCVSLDLPIAKAQTDPSGPTAEEQVLTRAAKQLRGHRILVADDVDMNRYVASEILKTFGCAVVEASDGEEVVEAVKTQRQLGTPFDACLMDVQMPILNGIEAAHAIRALEADSGGHLPIIALTGYAGPEARALCSDPMDDFITKPLIRGTLAHTLLKHVQLRPDAAMSDDDVASNVAVREPIQASSDACSFHACASTKVSGSFTLTQASSSFTTPRDKGSFASTSAAVAVAVEQHQRSPGCVLDQAAIDLHEQPSTAPEPEGAVLPALVVSRGYSRHVASIEDWLDGLNLQQHKSLFEAASITEASQLTKLTDANLRDMGMAVKGHRTRLLNAIHALDPSQLAAQSPQHQGVTVDAAPHARRAPVSELTAVDKSVFDPARMKSQFGFSDFTVKNMVSKFNGSPSLRSIDAAIINTDAAAITKAAHTIKGQLGYLQAHAAHAVAYELENEARRSIDMWSDERQEKLTALFTRLKVEVARVEANCEVVRGLTKT